MACTATDSEVLTPPAGSVEGDVYLVTQDGDTKRGAGLTVHIVASPDSVERVVARTCTAFDSSLAALNATTRRLTERAQEATESAQHPSVVGSRFARVARDSAEAAWRRARRSLDQSSQLIDSVALASVEPFLQATLDTIGTGVHAHYGFASVPPGEYGVFSMWSIADKDYVWWTRVTVREGEKVHRDLDNRALTELTCVMRSEVRAPD